MDYTKNYNLSKPTYDDDVDIQILNKNMDILDDLLNKMITNTDEASKQLYAPTLRLVKELFKIKNSKDVISALKTETLSSLGVEVIDDGEIICLKLGELFNNLIIQFGVCTANSETLVEQSVNYIHPFIRCYSVLATIYGNYSDSVTVLETTTTSLKYTCFKNFKEYTRIIRPVCWVAFGK